MPPRIRIISENKLKTTQSNTKVVRKPLADKTNSASDDTSVEIPMKSKKIITKSSKTVLKQNTDKKKNEERNQNSKQNAKQQQEIEQKENSIHIKDIRPRRERKLPPRFVENHVLKNLSNSKDSLNLTHDSSRTNFKAENTPATNVSQSKSDEPEPSPFKTPKADISLLPNRPRRICRLPSRFEDHSISPSRYIPIQPANASTPIQQSKTKPTPLQDKGNVNNKTTKEGKDLGKKEAPVGSTRLAKVNALRKESSDNRSDKTSPDSNNNGKFRSTRAKRSNNIQPINKKQSSVNVKKIQLPLNKTQSPEKKISSKITKLKSLINKKQSSVKKISSKITKLQSPVQKIDSNITKSQSPINKTQSPVNTITSSITRLESQKNKSLSPQKKIGFEESTEKKRLIDKNLSFKLLENKKKSQESVNKNLDVYEFTFDPNEEPQPQKKKRKKTVTKKRNKQPKEVVFKGFYYEQNISKALAALKKVIKPAKTAEAPKLNQITENIVEVSGNVEQNIVPTVMSTIQNNINKTNNVTLDDTGKNSVHERSNNPSIRVEDIAADIEPSIEHHDDINYSPVNSPKPKSPEASTNLKESSESHAHNNDPLNLQEELSFFDDPPVASSSMNMSVRHPLASPWRVEFGSLPIKWSANTYLKPNMTPAVESSFIRSEDSNKKKHVYTNILPNTNDTFPETADPTPNLKQTSIISFIKEMAEKSAKKKRGRSVSPTLFEEIGTNTEKSRKYSKKANSNKEVTSAANTSEEISRSTNDVSTEKEKSKEESENSKDEKENSKNEKRSRKRKNDDKICDRPAKSPRKQKDKDGTYFGFDDSENQDSENASPIKNDNNPKGRSLRPRSRAVLQEINGPTRAALPVAAKSIYSETVDRAYEELKSGANTLLNPENNVKDNAANTEDPSLNDDSQSVHLFEDIEFVHHLKPQRKSYGNPKKVAFRQPSYSGSDTQEDVVADEQRENESSDYDDLGDLTFEIPVVHEKKTKKKKKPKKLMSKKEEQEAETWAANFNSMCEDVEEFPLLIE